MLMVAVPRQGVGEGGRDGVSRAGLGAQLLVL